MSDTFAKKFKWELYLQKRTQNTPEGNIFSAPHFLSVWSWFTYSATPNLKISVSPFGYFVSYAFIGKPSDANLPGIKEYRWSIRLEQEQKFKYFNYSNRYSIEYRMRDLTNTDHYEPNLRFRYMAKLEKPVYGLLSKTRPVSFFISDEIFLQYGKAVRKNPNIFDQNRFAIGSSYEVFKNVKLSLNYLYIYQERNSGQEFDRANTIWIILTLDNLFSQFRKRSS